MEKSWKSVGQNVYEPCELIKHRHLKCHLSTDNKVMAVLCTMMFYPLVRKHTGYGSKFGSNLWTFFELTSIRIFNLQLIVTPDTLAKSTKDVWQYLGYVFKAF